jgi:hypothetical protein
LAGLVDAGAMMVAAMLPAAAYAATAAPPLPELSSNTARTPCARSNESMTLAPRSLKLPVGMSHSHLIHAGAPRSVRNSKGVQPSPRLIGSSVSDGNAARYRHKLAIFASICRLVMPLSGVSSSGV